MDFISNSAIQIQQMLQEIGVDNIESLFSDIPQNLRLPAYHEDDGLAEVEGMRLFEEIAHQNTFGKYVSYLGAGAYEHHVPALVGAICAKSEFLTAYTPYQPEISQGMLQAIFEFQSAICAITGLEVSNASLYDGSTACAEAMLLALRHHSTRNKIVIAGNLNPVASAVVRQYVACHYTEIVVIPFLQDGSLDLNAANTLIDAQTAAVLVQYPNYFGVIDALKEIISTAHAHEALVAISANPLVYGLYATAGELGADIAIGDIQPLGLPLQYGGPYAGYLACRQELVRQMPGRLVGETVDGQGKRGFVLTLQAREQHIRREKATSNICTNQALAALAGLTAILWYGKEGYKKLALTNYQRCAYLRDRLSRVPAIKVMSDAPHFNEFVITFDQPLQQVLAHFRQHGIEPGVPLKNAFPHLGEALLVAVTEMKTKQMLDHYVQVAQSLNKEVL